MSSNNIGSIYATTISSEKYIIIDSQNIELSGNVIIKDGLNISNGLLTTNSVVPNITNSASLGSTSKIWSNAYISDLSVSTIELSGNIVPLNANSSSLGSSVKLWSNAYINDVSATNIELSGNIVPLNANSSRLGSALKPWSNAYISDVSVSNIELSGNMVPLNANSSRLGSIVKQWSNAYISDVSVTNIELSGNMVPLNANKSSLGSGLKLWSNAYMCDVSVSNIELSGNIVPLNANSSSLGSALKPWRNAYISDVSITNIELSGNIVPLNANSSNLGSALKPWSNAYIRELSGTNIDVSGKLNIAGATKFSNSLEISGNVTFGGSTLYVPASFIIDPIGHGNNTGTVTVNGNLIVQGETTTINSSVVDISDKMIVLASNASNAIQANGAGFEISGAKVNFLYNNSSATFNSSIGISISGNVLPFANGSIGEASKVWNNAYISDVSATTIELSGNIVPLNVNSSRLGSGLKPWSNAYISDVSASTIELSGNIVPLNANSSRLGSSVKPWINSYIRDVSATNIELSGNIVPLNANSSNLGSALKLWSNAYISDVSVSTIELSGNIVPLITNRSNLGSALKQWSNAYISDVSITNIELSGNIVPLNANTSNLGSALKTWSNAYIRDISVSNIELSGNIVPLNANSSRLGSALKPWSNAYINDISATNIELSGNIVPLNANSSRLGSALKPWSNAYINDISVTNIEVSGNIIPLNTNSSILGSSLKKWTNVFVRDLSVNTINGQAYSAGGGSVNISSVSSNVVPSTTNTYTLGTATNYWSNAYIRDIKVSNRVYQEISGDISWSAVNGYYGLTKDAYPALNPLSSGVQAVKTWTNRNVTGSWTTVSWSPKLGIFLAISKTSSSNNLITSNNGINWNNTTLATGIYRDAATSYAHAYVCWSPELERFVAIAGTETNNIMYSSNGTSWTYITKDYNASIFRCISWSPQLGLFVIIVQNRDFVYTSNDGITWTQVTIIKSINDYVPQILDMCWCAELGIFVAVGDTQNTNHRIMTSKNGINWNFINAGIDHAFASICWSKELALFVVVSYGGTNRVSISNNGTQWTHINIGTTYSLQTVAWSPQLGLFIAGSTSNTILTSPNGRNWSVNNTSGGFRSACWSPELGIFVAVGANTIVTSSLKGRPPTSYNVFDSTFNSIDETGKWYFQNMYVATMTSAGGTSVNSDDRLKHNEVVIANGLAVIDQLCPKFYQKTFDMLDADYNGDLSKHAWIYEAGLIAQEVLQIPDLSFAVSGGDYYEKSYILRSQTYDPSLNIYDPSSNNIYDPSLNDYDISYNLIRQAYSLNYNSIYVYVVAAIKELHQKVKAQEMIILNRQTIINSCNARIEELEKSNQV